VFSTRLPMKRPRAAPMLDMTARLARKMGMRQPEVLRPTSR
jgi:hypothetical protein